MPLLRLLIPASNACIKYRILDAFYAADCVPEIASLICLA